MSEAQFAETPQEANSLKTGHKCIITVLKRGWDQSLADEYLADPDVGLAHGSGRGRSSLWMNMNISTC